MRQAGVSVQRAAATQRTKVAVASSILIDGKIMNRTTLSPETVAFLKMMRTKRNAESASSGLVDILQSVRPEHERASVPQAVNGYYESLTKEEAAEQSEWGEFALHEFPEESV
jgi:hypothetical protein